MESPHTRDMSIQNHFSDVPAARLTDGFPQAAPHRRLGLYESALRDRHVDLRKRFCDCGAQAMTDAELLELILLRTAPRTDTRANAKSLLERFGDFAGVISASSIHLDEAADPIASADLKLIEAAAQRLAKVKLNNKPLISSWDAVIDYCRTTLAHREIEEFRVLFMDRSNILIADEVLGIGTVDHVPVYPREILKRALELNACAIILVHNHPSGDPTPSDSDIAMTHLIKHAAESLSVTLHDHLIIGATSETSFANEGLL
jgi:DNA repair protein RadC